MPKDLDNASDWRGPNSCGQIPRYAAIAAILRDFRADQKVLDVGCGEALLHTYLPTDASYTGVERSALAAGLASGRDPSPRIILASAEDFELYGECFDTIVFNETLY